MNRPGMQWTPELSTGVEVLDAQHRELFAAVNALLDAVEAGGGRDEVSNLMLFLEDYTANHFSGEEIYMRRHTYPAYADHKAEHTAFIGGFLDLREALDENGPSRDLVAAIARRLCEWLSDHIGRTDLALAAFLREKRTG